MKEYLENLRKNNPLIHNITNYVTVNDCANILLAAGASPVMADDANEVEEIVKISDGLNINIGTLNKNTEKAMLKAGKEANRLNKPVELDPVGVGASSMRKDFINKLLNEVKFTVIKGNLSEIKVMAKGIGSSHGVDASKEDVVTKDNIESIIDYAQEFSKKTGAIIVITGATDIVANSDYAVAIKNGVSTMAKITGTGCMLSALITGYISVNQDNIFDSVVTAVSMMGLAGEFAEEKRIETNSGNSTFRNYLIDAISKMDEEDLEKGANYEVHSK
ncbi:hydroxyethylthiazole kinase [Companilactobacillus sp. DQM5]|uniref:hydroxyethylthiazole kinase n=1 Tax=Companilactobacillus sp. DQM5 TaxID=3463359 RepID=UPI00405922EF